MTPSTATLRFRIWQYASPREWDVTIPEIAEALGENMRIVQNVIRYAGWGSRVRTCQIARAEYSNGDPGSFAVGRHIAADLASGRIGNGEAI